MRHPRKIILLLWLLVIYLPGFSQTADLASFTALRSAGAIPADFLQSAQGVTPGSERKKSRARSADRMKGHEKFQMASGYGLNEMFLSGRVLFGDEVGKYVNRVADSLLRNFPDIRGQMRFYVTRSTVANAYSTDQGVVFINAGLIARLENEAQLAYVIAHEVVHFVKKHNVTIFLEKEKAASRKRRDNDYRDLSVFEKLLAVNYRSKEIETMADEVGLRSYLAHSSYDLKSAPGVLSVLLYSSFPFTNQPFDLRPLETGEMIIPDYYLIDEVDEFEVDENEADSLSTHPNVKKRRQRIGDLIDSIGEAGSLQFMQPREDFMRIRNLARFEVVRQLLISHRFAEALFCTSSLMEEFPDNFYLKKSYAAALYGLSASKVRGEISEKIQNYREVQGEMRQVNFMITKMSRRDANIVALGYVWRLHRDHPEDVYLSQIARALFADLVEECEVKKSFFHTKGLEELRAELAQPEVHDSVTDNSRLRKKKTRQSKIDTTFTKFAFIDLLKERDFNEDFDRALSRIDSAHNARQVQYAYSAFPGPSKSQSSVRKKADRKYVKRFLMADPYAIKVDNRKRDNVMYAESKMNHARIREHLAANAVRANLDMSFVDAKVLDENSVRDFNEMAFVKEYIEERFNQADGGLPVSYCRQNIDSLMQRSNTEYLGWTAIVSIQKKKPVAKLVVLSILPYLWPYTIYEFVTPKVHTYYYHVLFNVDTGRIRLARVSRVRSNPRRDQLNSHIYDFMYSIKKTWD